MAKIITRGVLPKYKYVGKELECGVCGRVFVIEKEDCDAGLVEEDIAGGVRSTETVPRMKCPFEECYGKGFPPSKANFYDR